MKNISIKSKWAVQQYDLFKGWDTWVIYDEKIHAENECLRRIEESPIHSKKNWRTIEIFQ